MALKPDKSYYTSLHQLIGFYPFDIKLYQEALSHRSAGTKSKGGEKIHNERLEFLGDAILSAIVSDVIYHHFKEENEGVLTTIRSTIVQRETLNKLAQDLNINQFLITSNDVNTTRNHILGNALEALIGAIYLDRGIEKAKEFIVEKIIKSYIHLDLLPQQCTNYKSKLLEWGQKNKTEIQFNISNEYIGENNVPFFEGEAIVDNKTIGKGQGNSKKRSTSKCSKRSFGGIRVR